MAEFASKGVSGTALGLGIAGTVGLVNQMSGGCGNGLFGGLFGSNCAQNRVSALEAELAKCQSERYTDQTTLSTQKETFREFQRADEKLAGVLEKVTSGFLEVGNAVSRMDKEIECIKTTMTKDQEINALKLKAVEERLGGAIALESERRTAGDSNLYCYVNATFVPGKLVMPKDSICPEVMPRYNNWVAPASQAPTSVELTNPVVNAQG